MRHIKKRTLVATGIFGPVQCRVGAAQHLLRVNLPRSREKGDAQTGGDQGRLVTKVKGLAQQRLMDLSPTRPGRGGWP
jgi:hypothetical protein